MTLSLLPLVLIAQIGGWPVFPKAVEAKPAPPMPFPSQAMDYAFMRCQEESLMAFVPKGNGNFMRAMPFKVSRAILKMQTSPYSRVREDGQRELRLAGPEWNYWALHIPVMEVYVRAEVNLYGLSKCPMNNGENHQYCSTCWGLECFWDIKPFLEEEAMRKARARAMREQERNQMQQEVAW